MALGLILIGWVGGVIGASVVGLVFDKGLLMSLAAFMASSTVTVFATAAGLLIRARLRSAAQSAQTAEVDSV